jgi:hypothetical protein
MHTQRAENVLLHTHLAALSESLDLQHDDIDVGGGYHDHILFGPEDDIRDASRAVKRLGFAHALCRLATTDKFALSIRHVWTPERTK